MKTKKIIFLTVSDTERINNVIRIMMVDAEDYDNNDNDDVFVTFTLRLCLFDFV